jgi:hypothetical protein
VKIYNSQDPNLYIFSTDGEQHWRRETVNRFLKRASAKAGIKHVYPNMLRHTFATNLIANGANLVEVKNALGHEKAETTTIYTHTSPDDLRKYINHETEKKSLITKATEFLFGKKKKRLPRIVSSNFSVKLYGRRKELEEAQNIIHKQVNLVITGEVGTGKNALLDSIHFNKKVLVLDNTKNFKKSILELLLMLFDNEKAKLAAALFPQQTKDSITAKLQRDNLINLCLLLIRVCDKHEYILKINDLDGLTPTTAKAFEIIKDHFVIAATSRGIAINNYTAVSDFHQVHLENLNRTDSLKLFVELVQDVDFEDFEHVKNQVWNASAGNPRSVTELAERFNKEQEELDPYTVEKICAKYIGKHIKEFDASMLFLVVFGVLLVAWVYMKSANMIDRRIGSAILGIIIIFGRYFLQFNKRKFV